MNFTFYPWGNAYYNICNTPNFDKEKGMDCWIQKCENNAVNEECFKGEILCQRKWLEKHSPVIYHYTRFKIQ